MSIFQVSNIACFLERQKQTWLQSHFFLLGGTPIMDQDPNLKVGGD